MATPPQNTLEEKLEERLSSIQVDKKEEETKTSAQKLNLTYVDLRSFPIDTNAVLLVDEGVARTSQLAAVEKTGQKLTVAVIDPNNAQTKYTLDELKNRGFTITLVLVSDLSLQVAWQRYALRKEKPSEIIGVLNIEQAEFADIAQQVKTIGDLKGKLSGIPITKVLEVVMMAALHIKASDIHVEPEETTIRLRYRLDGVLQDITNFDTSSYPNILSRIKLLSGLKINIHDTPQDGRFTIRQTDKDIEVRVSILPGAYGENIVMRILDPGSIDKKLEDLGMHNHVLEKAKKLIQKTTGAILTTGPTGSGKTTTLYTFIKEVNEPGSKIITIEDPIEYHIVGISQTQVDEHAGYTFAGGLRSIMRQDPDVILVGEIRDKETAEIAMQAALTGHLVFSTLHTNNAAGAIPRLIDLGVRPITIAPAIKAAMAQRLVRRFCEVCKKKDKIKPEDLDILKRNLAIVPKAIQTTEITDTMEIFYPVGCKECNGSGYKGRVGVYELFEIDNDIEKLILQSPPISEVNDLAIKKGMVPLLQDALLRVLEGTTSIEEVMRVIGE